MRAALLSAIALMLISLGLYLGGRLAVPGGPAPDASFVEAEPVAAGPAETGPQPGADEETPPGLSSAPSRLIAPAVVAPPQLGPNELQREAPRAPLSALALPSKPDEQDGGRLFRPLAVESAMVEATGRTVTIAGTESIAAGETCEFEGQPWACGMRARTAFRMWLRGRALDCDLPPDAGDEVAASCRLGTQDAGAWLVANGWARAAPGGPYVEAEAEARAAGKGIFGRPPAALPEDLGAADLSGAAAATLPAGQPMPAQ